MIRFEENIYRTTFWRAHGKMDQAGIGRLLSVRRALQVELLQGLLDAEAKQQSWIPGDTLLQLKLVF